MTADPSIELGEDDLRTGKKSVGYGSSVPMVCHTTLKEQKDGAQGRLIPAHVFDCGCRTVMESPWELEFWFYS